MKFRLRVFLHDHEVVSAEIAGEHGRREEDVEEASADTADRGDRRNAAHKRGELSGRRCSASLGQEDTAGRDDLRRRDRDCAGIHRRCIEHNLADRVIARLHTTVGNSRAHKTTRICAYTEVRTLATEGSEDGTDAQIILVGHADIIVAEGRIRRVNESIQSADRVIDTNQGNIDTRICTGNEDTAIRVEHAIRRAVCRRSIRIRSQDTLGLEGGGIDRSCIGQQLRIEDLRTNKCLSGLGVIGFHLRGKSTIQRGHLFYIFPRDFFTEKKI